MLGASADVSRAPQKESRLRAHGKASSGDATIWAMWLDSMPRAVHVGSHGAGVRGNQHATQGGRNAATGARRKGGDDGVGGARVDRSTDGSNSAAARGHRGTGRSDRRSESDARLARQRSEG